ncbi:S-adenosyl-L-methionine-dependent methyltransferase, partial [Blyttiomyces helicus]
ASLLHLATASGNIDAVRALLTTGHPWNAVDANGWSAGEEARKGGFEEIYKFLVAEGARVEFLLSALGDDSASAAAPAPASAHPSNVGYLSRRLTYSEGKLLDSDNNAVMMGWEAPLMVLHARAIAPTPGLDVLNVGFGLGLIDEELQKLKPKTHTIIEAHPDVYAKMVADGWDKKDGVRIVFGRWQDVIYDIGVFDGIFFDTFGEYYDDLKAFHECVPNILRETGTYSYFNGLAGTNPFFHDVACTIAEADLSELGLTTRFEDIEMDTLGDDVWKGIKRAYWSLPLYRLPTCTFE